MQSTKSDAMGVIVTGGAGFIGSHLCDYLLDKGHKVICLDNLSSGQKENIKKLLYDKNFIFIEHDIREPFITNEKIDQIYHLASKASPVDFPEDPTGILMTNSLGTYNILNLARKHNASVLFASTSEVYGDPEEHPQRESYWGHVNPIGIRSCYDESKRFGEALCMAFYRKYGLDVKIARIFNTFGPKMRIDDGRVIPNFITQSLKNEFITVYCDGKQTRSFCYISDMINGLTKLMESDFPGEPFNLGNTNETNILALAKMIKHITKTKSKIVFKPLPKDDPVRRKPEIRKATKKLKWKPEIGLEEGMKKTISYFKALLELST